MIATIKEIQTPGAILLVFVERSRNLANASTGQRAFVTRNKVIFGMEPIRPKPDRTQWERLSSRYAKPLRRFFERRLKIRSDLEDLVQEVFIRLLRQEHIGEVRNLDGYVFQVAANVLRDYARRWSIREQEANPVSLDDDVLEGGFSPERVLLGRETLERLIGALHELPTNTRSIFALYHFEGVAQVDIARKLNMSISTVEKHMARANRHLLAHLARLE